MPKEGECRVSPTGGEGDSSGSSLLIVLGIVAAGAIAIAGALGVSRVMRRSRL